MSGWDCEFCGNEAPGYEPEYCCDGYECGCGGMPAESCFCSDDCANAYEEKEERQRFVSREVGAIKRIRRKRLWKELRLEQERCMLSPELPESFTQWPLQMKSAFTDINAVRYKMQDDGRGGVWLFGDCPNSADHTYHGYTDRQQNGFAGAHVTFNLVDGGTITLKGPFKTSPPKNADQSVLTRGVIAREVSNHPELEDSFGSLRIYNDVIYLDRDWELGEYMRIDSLAQSLANERGEKLFYRKESLGGAMSAWANPVEQAMTT
ncbi:hypothetical protein [uncultured Paraglaciecola sp.]|uniref:hypothetical protein n=1 Tax=uncultured Paraglaciecola sp. TaxID=1765024 RepID=UPI002620274E|nr:hypothetical protein [uncultured Paraglaciecola sp.]